MKRKLTFFVVLLGMASSGLEVYAATADLSAQRADVFRGSVSTPLMPPSTQTALRTIQDFLWTQGYDSTTLASLEVVRRHESPSQGLTHYWLVQRFEGVEVDGTYVKAALDAEGALIGLLSLIHRGPEQDQLEPVLSHADALRVVLNRLYPQQSGTLAEVATDGPTRYYTRGTFFDVYPSVTRVWIPQAEGGVRSGYKVQTWDLQNRLHYTRVDGDGWLAGIQSRTYSERYNVFPIHPGVSPQTVQSGPESGSPDAPIGWIFDNTTRGNNVYAYLDRNDDADPDGNGSPVSSDLDFLSTANLSEEPTTPENQMVAVQNLFFQCNRVHDLLYRSGFTETAGNFQEQNFLQGGVEGDSLRAEAQDGGGLNNANFSTPDDGLHPRMQMYLWTSSVPQRDGSLDADIIYHEYGHGLTWRMIGDMSGPLAEAVGEGMGDGLAVLINNQDTVAEYATASTKGIRRYVYTDYPLTYGDVKGRSVHDDGEIYAATLWLLWKRFEEEGLSSELLLGYLVDGMNHTPSQPAFEHMRDGILAAISSSAHQCMVWEAFAHYGIGEGARAAYTGPRKRLSIQESFTIPAFCQ